MKEDPYLELISNWKLVSHQFFDIPPKSLALISGITSFRMGFT
jgi:hypothetical protein